MARSSADRPDAGDEDIDGSADLGDDPDSDENDLEADDSDEDEVSRSDVTDAFWAEVDMAPVEIALPGGVGYTLRAYRLSTEITPTDYTAREKDEFVSRHTVMSDDDVEDVFAGEFDDEEPEDDEDVRGEDVGDDQDEETDDAADDETDEEEASERAEPEEEVPLFLSHAGHLLLFRSRAGLVAFVQSDADHDLAQLEEWPTAVERLTADDVVALPEDVYELDLVVRNLRSGHDAWDPQLLVQSGELARDLGHALRIEPVVLAMASGSPLDDLDEAMRALVEGGFGAFRARRKAKKIGVETASIGWRTVIGKISAVADWRD